MEYLKIITVLGEGGRGTRYEKAHHDLPMRGGRLTPPWFYLAHFFFFPELLLFLSPLSRFRRILSAAAQQVPFLLLNGGRPATDLPRGGGKGNPEKRAACIQAKCRPKLKMKKEATVWTLPPRV